MKTTNPLYYVKVLLAVVLAFATLPASATLITNNSGLASPTSVITFDEIVLPSNTELLNTYQTLGVRFGTGMFYNTSNFGVPNASPPQAINFPGFTDPFDVIFTDVLTSAAMVIATNIASPNTVISALLNGVLVETHNISTSQTGTPNFFGFENILFNEIQISNLVSAIVVDNIQLGAAAVPEPTVMALLGLGLIGFGFSRRKQK